MSETVEINEIAKDVFSDPEYIRKSAAFVNKYLSDDCDVAVMGNGDVYVTQIKTVTLQYKWDAKKKKLVRDIGGRIKRLKQPKIQDDLHSEEIEDDLMEEMV